MSKREYFERIDFLFYECNLKYNPHFTLFLYNVFNSYCFYTSWKVLQISILALLAIRYDVLSSESTTSIALCITFSLQTSAKSILHKKIQIKPGRCKSVLKLGYMYRKCI